MCLFMMMSLDTLTELSIKLYTTYTSIIMLDCVFILEYCIVYGLKSCTVIMYF